MRILADNVSDCLLSPLQLGTVDSLLALAGYEGEIELDYDDLTKEQRAVLGELRADGLHLFVMCPDDVFMTGLVTGQTRWIKLECAGRPFTITAQMGP